MGGYWICGVWDCGFACFLVGEFALGFVMGAGWVVRGRWAGCMVCAFDFGFWYCCLICLSGVSLGWLEFLFVVCFDCLWFWLDCFSFVDFGRLVCDCVGMVWWLRFALGLVSGCVRLVWFRVGFGLMFLVICGVWCCGWIVLRIRVLVVVVGCRFQVWVGW